MTDVGVGFQVPRLAVKVSPTTASPARVGTGEEEKGVPAVTAAVADELTVLDWKPGREPVTRTVIVSPMSFVVTV